MFSSLRDLMLQRIDGLDDFTRKILHLASILGNTFTFKEILGLSEQVFSISGDMSEDHLAKVEDSLIVAVSQGILDDNAPHQSVHTKLYSMQDISVSSFPQHSEFEEDEFDDFIDNNVDEKHYQFSHDTWRQAILSLLLESYKKDMHMLAARSIESRMGSHEEADYHTKIKLFGHLKHSGDSSNATTLSLSVGESFMNLGLNLHCINIYEKALDMWRKSSLNDKDETLASIPLHIIKSLDKDNLKSIVRLLAASGQALGSTITRKAESARAFEDALQVRNEFTVISFLSQYFYIFYLTWNCSILLHK